ncbi:MAG: coenzyme F420--glutamate ligase [Chloroflexi bacterium OLB14]|nr:MAG: coenzyme F420--glutamate ligase [Chloroflexi bacterium OLB14]
MTNINLQDFLRTRRSIRRFKTDLVPDSVISEILLTSTFAPSAHHRQPWRFVVLKNDSAKQHLADSMANAFEKDLQQDNLPQAEIDKLIQRSKSRINGAPVVIMLCLDMTDMNQYEDKKRNRAEFLTATQSVANAGMQLLLAAHAEGLGSVWVCSPIFAQETVQQALDIPKTWEPQAMFLIGYPADAPKVRERKSLEEIVKFV